MSAPAFVPLGPGADPWEPEGSRRTGRHLLTSVEITVTNRCNMRCVHCAVGATLATSEPERLPLNLLFRRLDEVPALRTLSITGGEPSESLATLQDYVLPILQYARGRGIITQVNTNLSHDLERYILIAPGVDVFHITWNYPTVAEFHHTVWGHGREHVSPAASEMLFERIVQNAGALARAGSFVSAETMVNRHTAPHLGALNRVIAAMGCRRHEVHPMYPAGWASDLPLLALDQYREAIGRFLGERDPDLWVLFGTFPFLACSPHPEDRKFLAVARSAPGVSIRNCPDGRNRVNIDALSGAVRVTDFAEIPPLGRVQEDRLCDLFYCWQGDEAFAPYNCYCPDAGCTGPNLLVAAMYHPGVDFRRRRAWTK